MRASRLCKEANIIHEWAKKYQDLPIIKWVRDWFAKRKMVQRLSNQLPPTGVVDKVKGLWAGKDDIAEFVGAPGITALSKANLATVLAGKYDTVDARRQAISNAITPDMATHFGRTRVNQWADAGIAASDKARALKNPQGTIPAAPAAPVSPIDQGLRLPVFGQVNNTATPDLRSVVW